MEDLLTNAFNTGDIKIVIAALAVYVIIYLQRKDTKGKRDDAHEDLDKRLTLVESKVRKIDELDLDARLAAIETSLKYIQLLLENKQDK